MRCKAEKFYQASGMDGEVGRVQSLRPKMSVEVDPESSTKG